MSSIFFLFHSVSFNFAICRELRTYVKVRCLCDWLINSVLIFVSYIWAWRVRGRDYKYSCYNGAVYWSFVLKSKQIDPYGGFNKVFSNLIAIRRDFKSIGTQPNTQMNCVVAITSLWGPGFRFLFYSFQFPWEEIWFIFFFLCLPQTNCARCKCLKAAVWWENRVLRAIIQGF